MPPVPVDAGRDNPRPRDVQQAGNTQRGGRARDLPRKENILQNQVGEKLAAVILEDFFPHYLFWPFLCLVELSSLAIFSQIFPPIIYLATSPSW